MCFDKEGRSGCSPNFNFFLVGAYGLVGMVASLFALKEIPRGTERRDPRLVL